MKTSEHGWDDVDWEASEPKNSRLRLRRFHFQFEIYFFRGQSQAEVYVRADNMLLLKLADLKCSSFASKIMLTPHAVSVSGTYYLLC